MFCPQCGDESSDKDKFCRSCGEALKVGGGEEAIVESTALTEEIQVVRNEMEGQSKKPFYWLLAAAVFWFIAINPAQGNFLGLTYLDLALLDCGDSDSGSSSGFDFIDDFGDDLDEACRDIRGESQILVIFGITAIIFLIRMATKKPNFDRLDQRGGGKEDFQKLQKKASSQRAKEKEQKRKREVFGIKKKIADLEAELSESKTQWELNEQEWDDIQKSISERRSGFTRLSVTSVVSGSLLGGAILLASAVRLHIPETRLHDYFTWTLYASWALPVIMWVNLASKPILPKDHHLAILSEKIASKEGELSDLEIRLRGLRKPTGEEEE